jgi:hypothetical protein
MNLDDALSRLEEFVTAAEDTAVYQDRRDPIETLAERRGVSAVTLIEEAVTDLRRYTEGPRSEHGDSIALRLVAALNELNAVADDEAH